MERRRVRPRHPHQHRHRHHHRTESQTNARQAFHPRSLRLSRTTRRQGRRSAAQRNRARRPHVDPLRRTGSRRRADRAHLGPGTRRIHAHWRIAHRAQERRRRHLFRIHRGLRHGLGQGQRGRRAQLCRHLDRAGEGLQKDRVRPQQGHQHHPQIHDLPRRAAVRAAHLVAGARGRRLGRSRLHRPPR